MEEIRAYKPCCCKKAYLNKSSAAHHEKRCFKNPDNKACLSCGNFKQDWNTVYVPPRDNNNYGDDDYEEEYKFCNWSGEVFRGYRNGTQEFQKNCKHWIPNLEKADRE